MNQTKKMSLPAAILLNINIVIGGGFFLSASNVFKTSGILAPLTWIFCGMLLFPLVHVLAKLTSLYPTAGGLYIYSKKQLGDFWGFVSGWGYFVGTVAGNAIILHAFSMLIQKLGFNIPYASPFILDLIFVIIFIAIDWFNVTFLEKMNIGFTILKTIPIALVLFTMFFLFDTTNIVTAPIKPFGFFESMPIVLFAFLGIESCCAITHAIKDGKKNSARAMLISLGLIIAIYALVQFGLIAILGTSCNNPFFNIIPLLTKNTMFIFWGNLVIKVAILSSYLGSFYGTFYSNSWNLYAIAAEKKILFSNTLIKSNKYHSPWVCSITQGALVILFLFIAFNSKETLMTMNGFGAVIAYILSTITYLFIARNKKSGITIGIFALFGCLILLGLCLNDLINDGLQYLIPFFAILALGLVLYKRD